MRPLNFKSHYTNPHGYLTKWSRHIHNVLINGFMARELDADDHEFLEYVREHGIANGSLPNTSLASVEELDFWHLPYDVQPGVERREGPVARRAQRPVETAEQTRARLARTNAWHARRVIREQERAIAAAEMERERAEWVAANEKRKAQEIMTEAEWQAADPFRGKRPPKPTWGATVDRHYVPQWKIDEHIDDIVAKAETKKAGAKDAKAAKRAARAAKRQADEEFNRAAVAKAKQEIEAAKAAARALEQEAYYEARRREAEDRARTRNEAKQRAEHWERVALQAEAKRAALEADRLRREAIIAEARKTVDHAARLDREQPAGAGPAAAYTVPTLKQAIMTLGRSTPGHVWTPEDMIRALGCERSLLDYCLDRLVREGQLRITEPEKISGAPLSDTEWNDRANQARITAQHNDRKMKIDRLMREFTAKGVEGVRLESLMHLTDCNDRAEMLRCIQELELETKVQ